MTYTCPKSEFIRPSHIFTIFSYDSVIHSQRGDLKVREFCRVDNGINFAFLRLCHVVLRRDGLIAELLTIIGRKVVFTKELAEQPAKHVFISLKTNASNIVLVT